MLCHENLLSYYKTTNDLMFRRKDSAFEIHFTLEDLENMLPYERTIHLIQINNKISEYENNNQE